jgi:hypothetical protein
MATRPSSAAPLGFVFALALTAPATAASLGGPNWSGVPHSNIDPQIAAGPNRVLIALYDHIYYYDKSGRPITHVDDNPGKPTLVSYLEELFDPIRADADANLALPPGTTCDRTHRDEPSYVRQAKGPDRTVSNYCLDRFGYDARVLYDEYRERFVVVAAAINTGAKCKFNPGESNYFARRNKILVAYSATSDPTDGTGWHLKWFDAVPGESCRTQTCRDEAGYLPGTASDYPVAAVVKDYLLVSINNQAHEKLDGDTCPPCTGAKCDPEKYGYEDDFFPLPSTVHVWSTKGLASGRFDEKTCGGLCSWVYHNGDIRGAANLPVTGSPTLAQGHGEPHLGSAFFADKSGTDGLNIWRFSITGGKERPPLVRQRVELPSFVPIIEYPNAYGSGTHAPLLVNGTTALVQRGSHLFYADVGTAPQSFAAGIRLVGLQGNVLGLFTLGRHAIFGEPGQGYGSPALEVTAENEMILAYRKVGERAAAGFGARYLVWKSGTSTAPGGHTLADDEFDLPCPDKECKAQGDHDTAGIALAPHGRVYVMQPYLDKRTRDWAYAVNYVVP